MDKRKNNGGHSTKATNPNDKRLNKAKTLLDQYIQEDFNYNSMKALLGKLYQQAIEGDTKSASLFLSYILGRPKEYKDITSNGETLNFGSIDWFKSDEAE